ncbi:unnamed protein product [Ilex paraguariensis]|uniref:AT5G11810-like protein n=1 Tax=Ilex paraguariensis TaxID=185542 RepID=A0ABC8UG86_9AQUA
MMEYIVTALVVGFQSGEDTSKVACQGKSLMPTISERFMGMRAAIVTDNPSLRSFGGKLGFTVLQLVDLIDSSHPLAESPHDVVVSELLRLLGFQGGKTLEASQYDLVLVHMVAGEKSNGGKNMKSVHGLVGELMHMAEPGSEIGSRLHISLVMSYGTVSENDDLSLSVLNTNQQTNLSLLFPRQSYTMKGGHPRENVRHHCPMLIAQWQHAVTRKDLAETFSFRDFKEHGGNLTIPADRFLHEVAFKLWKAPKYGA